MASFSWPVITASVSSSSAPVQFVLNGVDTEVSEVTGTPANSRPLPAKILDENGASAIGATNESAAATDTSTSGLNGLLKRIAQRTTSLIALFPTTIGQKNSAGSLSVVVASDQTLPISAASLPLPTSAATEAKQDSQITLIGAVNESAPASDTASSGLNGRLQRIAQNITSLISKLPSALGQTTMSASLPVTLASDQTGLNTFLDKSSSGSLVNINDNVTVACNGASVVGITITGTWSGTLQFLGSSDNGTTYNAVTVFTKLATGAGASTTTANSQLYGNVAGLTHFKVNRSVATSGTAEVMITASAGVSHVQVFSANANNFLAAVTQSGVWTQRLNDGGGTSVTVGQKTMSSSLPVAIASDQGALTVSGSVTASAPVYKEKYTLDFSSSNLSTSAYTQLAASTTNNLTAFEIYTTTTEPLILATGAAASEVDKFYILPGGNAPNLIYLTVSSSTRLSLKALNSAVSSGYILVNCLG